MIINTELIDRLLEKYSSERIAEETGLSKRTLEGYKQGRKWIADNTLKLSEGMMNIVAEEYAELKNFIEDDLIDKELGHGVPDFDINQVMQGKTISFETKDYVKTEVKISLSVDLEFENKIDEYMTEFAGEEIAVYYVKP